MMHSPQMYIIYAIMCTICKMYFLNKQICEKCISSSHIYSTYVGNIGSHVQHMCTSTSAHMCSQEHIHIIFAVVHI